MTDHPITPPPELVREWNEAAIGTHFPPYGYSEYIAAQAARWGADQELEACCEILRGEFNYHHIAEPLRATRRPKPPSLVEEALNALVHLCDGASNSMDTVEAAEYIQRALERLQQLEDSND